MEGEVEENLKKKKRERKKEGKKDSEREAEAKSIESHSWPPPVIRGDCLGNLPFLP